MRITTSSDLTVNSYMYGPEMDFGYVITVTLTSEIRPRFKVMTHP